jgi:hypothetical protein
MGLWGFKNRDDAVVAKRLVDERRHLPAYSEIGTPEELPDWAQDACLAVVTTQIPARSGRTAGGPVTATLAATEYRDQSDRRRNRRRIDRPGVFVGRCRFQ